MIIHYRKPEIELDIDNLWRCFREVHIGLSIIHGYKWFQIYLALGIFSFKLKVRWYD